MGEAFRYGVPTNFSVESGAHESAVFSKASDLGMIGSIFLLFPVRSPFLPCKKKTFRALRSSTFGMHYYQRLRALQLSQTRNEPIQNLVKSVF